MRVLGIDEAGRGCVLGPLVIAGFVTDDVTEQALRDVGADDSKRLSASRRSEVREALTALGQAQMHTIQPQQIDLNNLNFLEEQAIVATVRRWRPHRVMVDALGHPSSIPALQRRLAVGAGEEVCAEWTIEPKADHTYAVVGAASIFAKTTRDAHLDALRDQWGDLGSGYPSDPKTRSWLLDWARTKRPWPDFVRTRWATIANLQQQALL